MRYLTILTLIFSFSVLAKQNPFKDDRIRIAVIDTGILQHMATMPYMCKDGFKSIPGISPEDKNGHGSNIVGIISKTVNPLTHCVVSINFYSQHGTATQKLQNLIQALKMVVSDKRIKYLNLSLGGPVPDTEERIYIKKILDMGIIVVAAAGNNGENLDKKLNTYYPASYRHEFKYNNFYVVGSLLMSTNYGSIVTDILSGTNVDPKIPGVPVLSGTSQAAAQKMQKILKNVVLVSKEKNNAKQPDSFGRRPDYR